VNWVQRGNRWLSSPYQIVSNVRGYEAWIYSAKKSGVIAREIKTLVEAESICEKHAMVEKLKQAQPA
jgi:hypothetical protein